MSPQFTNMNEMMAYFDGLEQRIAALESAPGETGMESTPAVETRLAALEAALASPPDSPEPWSALEERLFRLEAAPAPVAPALETRVAALEVENQQLREMLTLQMTSHPAAPASSTRAVTVDAKSVITVMKQELPKTALLSKNFIARAFTVWGHSLFAQLAVGVILWLVYVAVMVFVFGANLGSLLTTAP